MVLTMLACVAANKISLLSLIIYSGKTIDINYLDADLDVLWGFYDTAL